MTITVRKLAERLGTPLSRTVYRGEAKEILDYPLVAADFFEALDGLEKGRNYAEIHAFCKALDREQDKKGIPGQRMRVAWNHEQAVEVKRSLHGQEKKRELKRLAEERHQLNEGIGCLFEECMAAVTKEFGENRGRLSFFEYKNRVLLTSYANIVQMLPCLGRSKMRELWSFPWMTTDLGELAGRVGSGGPIGVVGGPCLFGIDEVLMELQLQDGSREYFDCSCGRRCAREGRGEVGLSDYLEEHGHQVRGGRILNRKAGVTRQELISLLYVFEAAALLGGRIVVPLPDMSYIKYMENDLRALREPLRGEILENFEMETYRISDLFLELIEVLRGKYPQLEVVVLHKREEGLLKLFYDKREPFMNNSSYMRKLTQSEGRKEAIVDYITMLALPYYIYGTEDILQLDSLDETDSGRKCQKIHKGRIRLHSMLYPEFISRDGQHTIYNARLGYKDYQKKEDYGKWLEKANSFGDF